MQVADDWLQCNTQKDLLEREEQTEQQKVVIYGVNVKRRRQVAVTMLN